MCGPLRAFYVEYWRLLLGGSLPSPLRESRSLLPCASVSHWDRFATSPAPTYVRLVVCICPCRDWIQSRGEGNLAVIRTPTNTFLSILIILENTVKIQQNTNDFRAGDTGVLQCGMDKILHIIAPVIWLSCYNYSSCKLVWDNSLSIDICQQWTNIFVYPIAKPDSNTFGNMSQRSLCRSYITHDPFNMIQGKSMLENIWLTWTYQTLKSSGILHRNCYITTYSVYERIWNLGETKYSKHDVQRQRARLARVQHQARCMPFDWNVILHNHVQSNDTLIIWWWPRLEEADRTCVGLNPWPRKPGASDESLAFSAVVIIKLKRSIIN